MVCWLRIKQTKMSVFWPQMILFHFTSEMWCAFFLSPKQRWHGDRWRTQGSLSRSRSSLNNWITEIVGSTLNARVPIGVRKRSATSEIITLTSQMLWFQKQGHTKLYRVNMNYNLCVCVAHSHHHYSIFFTRSLFTLIFHSYLEGATPKMQCEYIVTFPIFQSQTGTPILCHQKSSLKPAWVNELLVGNRLPKAGFCSGILGLW